MSMFTPYSVVRIVVLFALATLPNSFAQQSPPAPPEFSVASVKRAVDPATSNGLYGMHGGPGSSTPGVVRFGRMPLFQLLARAYDIAPEAIEGPAWIKDFSGQNWYDIEAKMPPATTMLEFQLMLQTLLVDRFDLKVHREMRKTPGYRLLVQNSGPRLSATPAISSEQVGPQTRSQSVPSYDRDGSIRLPPGEGNWVTVTPGAQHVAYRGVTLDVFAEKLGRMINASVGVGGNTPIPHVLNQTGLQGRYDFTLDFACPLCQSVLSALPQFQGRQEVTPSDAQIDSAVRFPNLFDALQRQLGLRLEKSDSVPTEIMVVDAALKTPKPN